MSLFTFSSFSAASTLRALALAAAATTVGLTQAQDLPQMPTPVSVAAAASAEAVPGHASGTAPLGRTRAEVLAELACARATGELEAQMLRSYGLEPLAPQRRAGCVTGATAQAAAPVQAPAAQAR